MSQLLAHTQTLQQIDNFIHSPVHAVGLSGEAGCGKGYLAEIIACRLLDIKSAHNHPYIYRLDAGDIKTGIDDIRNLQNFLKLKVPGSTIVKRILIIEQIDLLRHEAQNSLLKTLEEPPTDTVIIVTYSQPTSILPTIKSRLRHIKVLPIDLKTAISNLQHPETDITRAFYISNGQPALLTALLNESSDHPLMKGVDAAREVLKSSRYERLSQIDKIIKNSDIPAATLLDGLYRLLNASYKQASKTKSPKDLIPYIKRLDLIEKSISDLNDNVQPKIVLDRLFLEL